MKVMTKTVVSAALIVVAVMASGAALAHRTSVGIGIGFGFPGYYGPGPYYYPPAYYPPAAYPYYDPYYPAVPTTYCDQAQAYYPYVREGAGGWRKVAPTPPGG